MDGDKGGHALVVQGEPVAEVGDEFIHFLRKRPDGSHWPSGTKLYAVAPAPVAQPASRMSAIAKRKADDLVAQGYEVAGYVLEKDGDRSAVLWDAAVRWVTPDERKRLMHVEGSLAAPAPVAQPVDWLRTLLDAVMAFRHDPAGMVRGGEYVRADALIEAALAAPAPVAQGEEMSPEFTDSARAALLWVLWHHQGASSKVGQPIRFALGMGAHEELGERRIAEAKRWAALAAPAPVAQPLTDERIDAITLSFDWTGMPCAAHARAVERACADAWGVKLAEVTGQEGGA